MITGSGIVSITANLQEWDVVTPVIVISKFAVTLGHLKIVPAVSGLCIEPCDHTVVPVDGIVGCMTVVVCPS